MAEIKLKPIKPKEKKRYGGKVVRNKKRKAGEDACRESFKRTPIALHKFPDHRMCYNCNAIIPKSDEQPDYIASIDWFYVEAKECDSMGYFRWADPKKGFTPIQRRRLAEHEGYVYLVMREPNGRAPDGVSAYVIPWDDWLDIEVRLELNGAKSIRRTATKKLPGADELLTAYQCEWQAGSKDKGGWWQLPEYFRRDIWTRYRKKSSLSKRAHYLHMRPRSRRLPPSG
jgi:hypothetical protein